MTGRPCTGSAPPHQPSTLSASLKSPDRSRADAHRQRTAEAQERARAARDEFLDDMARMLVDRLKESMPLLEYFASADAGSAPIDERVYEAVVVSISSIVNPATLTVAPGWSLVEWSGEASRAPGLVQGYMTGDCGRVAGQPVVVMQGHMHHLGGHTWLVAPGGVVASGWLARSEGQA